MSPARPGAARRSTTIARDRYDAVIVGSGPNGLAAAITLARAGREVLLVEAQDDIGGGMRTVECTLPGFRHDRCSTIHALGLASPFFRDLDLAEHGLSWVHADAPCAHPIPDGPVAVAEHDLERTCRQLGADGDAYRRLYAPLLAGVDALLEHNLGPFRLPRNPFLSARFGWSALRSATSLARRFRTDAARGLFAGMAAHSIQPLERPLTSAIALMLTLTAHDRGWPMAAGGSQSLADAMGSLLESLGGEIVVGTRVGSLAELPEARAYLLDVSPQALADLAADRLPEGYRRRLRRYRHGPGAFKLDWALDGPIPWKQAECARAGTVHLGGTLEQIAEAERAPWQGRSSDRPFLLVAQQSLFDPTRAPEGRHTAWAYAHVPARSPEDHREQIEAQMERYAPGFRDRILARHATGPADFEAANPNCVGGDITGGVMDATQLYTRPVARLCPYSTPDPKVFLCSASTPPGAGVHGMCGWHAARAALRRALRD